MESRNVMKKYIGILAKITGFILIVILAVNIILPLIKRNPDAAYEKELEQTTFTEETMKDVGGNQAGKKNPIRQGANGSAVLMTMKRLCCGGSV